MPFRCRPAVGGCQLIRIMPEVGRPFPDVAMHIIEAEGVGRERSWFHRAGGQTENRLRRVNYVPTAITSAGACAAGILPLRLRGNSVVLFSSRGQPLHKRLGLVKGNACRRDP